MKETNSPLPLIEKIIDLHNYIFFFLIMISVFVFVIFVNILIDSGYGFNEKTLNLILKCVNFRYDLYLINKLTHNTLIGLILTIVQPIILICIIIIIKQIAK